MKLDTLQVNFQDVLTVLFRVGIFKRKDQTKGAITIEKGD